MLIVPPQITKALTDLFHLGAFQRILYSRSAIHSSKKDMQWDGIFFRWRQFQLRFRPARGTRESIRINKSGKWVWRRSKKKVALIRLSTALSNKIHFMRADYSAITFIVFIECPPVVCSSAVSFFAHSSSSSVTVASALSFLNVNNKETRNKYVSYEWEGAHTHTQFQQQNEENFEKW